MKQKIELTKTVLIVLLVLLVIGNAFYVQQLRADLQEQVSLNDALASEVQTWKDKDGLNRASIQALETENTKTFLAVKTQDSTIKELQSLVKEFDKKFKKLESAIVMSSRTRIDTVLVPTEVTGISIDSTRGKIATTFKNEWIEADYGFDLSYKPEQRSYVADSTYLKLGIVNKYSVVIGYEKEGFLGMFKGNPVVEVKNHNPYTETETLRAFKTNGDVNKPWGIGLSAGITYAEKFRPYIGLGINYTVFKL